MIVRMFAVSVVAASFLGVPALCMGGVITHACDCASETACNCQADCDHDSGCGHESGCSDDPCSIQVVRTDRQGPEVVTVSSHAIPATFVHSIDTQPSPQTVCACVRERFGGDTLPFPPSDLPLLI